MENYEKGPFTEETVYPSVLMRLYAGVADRFVQVMVV